MSRAVVKLTHGVCCLAPEESRIDGRRHNNDPCLPSLIFEVGKTGLDCSIKPLRIDSLHQLEPLHWRIFDRSPPDSSGVVNHGVYASIVLHGVVNQLGNAIKVSGVDWECKSVSTSFCDFSRYGIDGRLRRIWVWREGFGLGCVRGGFGGYDNCKLSVSWIRVRGGHHNTRIAILRQVNGYLPANASRGANDKSNLLS